MYQSNQSFKIWPPPPVFELLKIGLFRFPHLGAKQLFKLMPHQLVLKYLSLKTNFLFSHSERYAVLTPSNFFVNPSNLAKMKKLTGILCQNNR